MKRLFDFFLSALGLALLWPIFVVIALLIKIEDRNGVFFRQKRIGRGGEPFFIWKFRTMVPDAERQGKSLTVGRDQRITRVGHWLRKTKLDELPQLINVLVGEMSFVGPRPEVPTYVDNYTPQQRRVLDLLPGITDVASVRFADESELLAKVDDPERYYRDEIVPQKISLNLSYASQATIWTDMLVILRTFVRLARC